MRDMVSSLLLSTSEVNSTNVQISINNVIVYKLLSYSFSKYFIITFSERKKEILRKGGQNNYDHN